MTDLLLTRIRCASPTCRTEITLSSPRPERTLAMLGWRTETQPGDDRARPYCPRCHL